MDKYFALKAVLFDIEEQLRTLKLWSETPPSKEQLNSTMPFCVDTLAFHQWLQFVLLPALYKIIEEEGSISLGAKIHPMAEESLSKYERTQALLNCMLELDEALA